MNLKNNTLKHLFIFLTLLAAWFYTGLGVSYAGDCPFQGNHYCCYDGGWGQYYACGGENQCVSIGGTNAWRGSKEYNQDCMNSYGNGESQYVQAFKASCGGCRWDDPGNPTPPATYTVAGYIRNSQTNAGIPGVSVFITNNAVPSATATVQTDATGRFSNDTVVLASQAYAVRILATPSGYLAPPITTNNTSSWIDCNNVNTQTPFKSTSYECQNPNHAQGDCAANSGQCNFVFEPQIMIRVVGTVDDTYYNNKRWGRAGTASVSCPIAAFSSGDLQVSHGGYTTQWGCTPSAAYYYIANVPYSTGSKTITLNRPLTPTGYDCSNFTWAMRHNGVVVQSGTGCTANVTFTNRGDLNWANNLTWYIKPQTNTISGNLQIVNSTCGSATPLASVTPSSFSYNYTQNDPANSPKVSSFNANVPTYAIPAPGVASNVLGELCMPPTFYSSDGTTRYDIRCFNGSASLTPSAPCVDFSAFTTNLTNQNFGYVAVLLFNNGWFQSINGDIYGPTLSTSIPPAADLVGNFKSYMATRTNATNKSPVVFSRSLSINDDTRITESNKYTKNLINQINLSSFDPRFIDNLSPTEITSLNSLATNTLYKVTASGPITSFFASGGTYSLSGSNDGITVVYCARSGTNLCNININNPKTTSNPNRRILFIIDGSVTINSSIGTPAPTAVTAEHLQVAIIATGDITFTAASPAPDLNTIIVEGPLVSTNGNVKFLRNLGATENAKRPAHVVRYNDIYLRSLNQYFKQLGISDVTWVVEN